MEEVVTPFMVCFRLIYIFLEVMLMSGIDGTKSCLEDYILFILFYYLFVSNHYLDMLPSLSEGSVYRAPQN